MFDIEEIMAKINEERKESVQNLTLGELKSKLNQFGDEEKFRLSNGFCLDGTFDSYRGYYEDIYFEYCNEDEGFNTIGQLKEMLNKAFEQKVMTGYKGGEFEINENTLVWISSYGSCGNIMLVDIQKINNIVILIVLNNRE